MENTIENNLLNVRLPYAYAKKYRVVIAYHENSPEIRHLRSTPIHALLEAQRLIGHLSPFSIISETDFKQQLRSIYDNQNQSSQGVADDINEKFDLSALADAIPETEDLMEQEDEAPIIKLLNTLLTEAIRQHASDVHIETFEKNMLVRFRIDGVLREILQPKRALAPMLISRIKVMAGLDIAEKRVPQDGRISLRVAGHDVDIRVSTMPASNGERVVLRLLDKQASKLNFSSLGMASDMRQQLDTLLHSAHGILLITGPTGSGKTTTLYAGLSLIENGQKNILTIEDPIEYNLEGIGQTQVNIKAGMTFARGLRAMLRQDPDIVMVGEIRDLETAQIAVQASLTGHLVLSTLHTNTAIGAITRLEEMGVESFLLSSSLIAVLAQRLVRVLCRHCKEPHSTDQAEMKLLGLTTAHEIFNANGCDKCNHQGYRGRTGIYELISIDDSLRKLIHNKCSEAELTQLARQSGVNIFTDGKNRILSGETTIDEVLRVTLE